MIAEHISDLLSAPQFLHIHEFEGLHRLYLKLEGLNPAGSIKFKAARSMVAAAERDGYLRPGQVTTRLIESTSGNLGVALAMVCAAKGYPLTLVVDPNTNQPAITTMRSLGAEVVVIRERDANGGFLGSRIAYIQARVAAEQGTLWLNQYANPANPAAHATYTAPEILGTFRRVDYLFAGTGTGGTLMGCVDAFRRYSPHTRIVAVDAAGSVTFGATPAPRHVPGLGASRRPELVDVCAPDDVIHIPEEATVAECRLLARTTGLLAGGSTGTVLAAVRRLAPIIPARATVVAISPDLGERYLSTIYDDAWVAARGLAGAPKEAADVLV
ncbi:2,3-diaminopropionate biosynthesis protein SbnA [Actinoplanes ianthinogenes]|uniref:2,3-diaminopropionate biosynthesis protein SbnA n=1 Tax=Actinoplanes ianthinogenes TaxID=122358 RepID=A0ABM7LNT2_9ACTN|nr:2,3-diaminopropionate biosynthesis protein SbnA [Actinoplanes ianthinogenes]BCJ40854.1 2,3-diaminopropionate biosynthesis protein SbnA [Actinoplanes ianthinogenes]GGR24755.1 2,3-diaminopropionate biosynthesis protein SbnA [Actinoplanes ianthinogenes]